MSTAHHPTHEPQPEESNSTSEASTPTPAESASALSAAIATTLGPNGMDKMLIGSNGRVVVTNDGASILDRMDIDDPIGWVLAKTLQRQRSGVHDGTTTTLLLVGELLAAAESLQDDGVHPTAIIEGYYNAMTTARDRFPAYARKVEADDADRLRRVAATAVTGRWDDRSAERFADLAVSALEAVEFDRSRLTLDAYPGGGLDESTVIDGLLVDLDASSTAVEGSKTRAQRLQPTAAPRIALVAAPLAVARPKHVEAVRPRSADHVREFQRHEEEIRARIVRRLLAVGADAVFCQKSIDDEVRSALTAEGVLAVERTRQDEFDRLARVTGATPVRSVEELAASDLGSAEKIRHRRIGQTDALIVTGCPEESPASLVVRGGTPHVTDEVERIARTCVHVVATAVDDGSVLPGGGAAAAAIARELSAAAASVGDRTQLAVDAFAGALERIPRVLATNAGSDPIEVLATLRRSHDAGESATGVDASGVPADMFDRGVVEPLSVFDRCLVTAVEAAAMLLRIDSIRVSTRSPAPETNSNTQSGCGHDGHCGCTYPWALSH